MTAKGSESMADSQRGIDFLKSIQSQKKGKKPDFADFSDFIEEHAREKGVPVRGQFELTPLCNFDCKMCYVHLTGEQLSGRTVLRPEQWKELMHQAWEAGMIRAILTGGECLAYPGFEEVYLYLHSLGCEIFIMTNGALLDQKRVDFLLKHRPAKIQITLYGNSEEAYQRVTGQRTFQPVMENILRVKEAGLPLLLTVTPNIYLGEDVYETIRLAKQICPNVIVNSSLFEPREETGRSFGEHDLDLEHYIQIYKFEAELRGEPTESPQDIILPEPGGPADGNPEKGLLCGAGRSGFFIDWEGSMFPCSELRAIKASPIEAGFRNAWESVHEQAANWIREPACSGCPYEDVCRNCAADLYRYSCPGDKPRAWCKRTVELVRHGIWKLPECE